MLLSSAWGRQITPQVILAYLGLGLWALPLQVAFLAEFLNHESLLEYGILFVIVTQLVDLPPQCECSVGDHLQDASRSHQVQTEQHGSLRSVQLQLAGNLLLATVSHVRPVNTE